MQFLKNLALQRHQVGVTIVQLVVPCALIGLVGLIQVLVDRAALQNTAPTPELYSPLNVSRTIPLATHCNDTLPDGCVTLPEYVARSMITSWTLDAAALTRLLCSSHVHANRTAS